MNSLDTQCGMTASGSALLNPGIHIDLSVASSIYDADSGGSLCTDGDDIGRIEDQSGNGNHMTQPTVAYRPIYDAVNAVANGNPCWLNNTGAGRLGMLTPSITIKEWLIVVAYKDGVDAAFDTFDYLFTSDGTNGYPGVVGQSGNDYLHNTTGSITDVSVNDAALDDQVLPLPLAVVRVPLASAHTGVFTFGHLPSFNGRTWEGPFCEIKGYSEYLSSAQATSEYTALASKWGIS